MYKIHNSHSVFLQFSKTKKYEDFAFLICNMYNSHFVRFVIFVNSYKNPYIYIYIYSYLLICIYIFSLIYILINLYIYIFIDKYTVRREDHCDYAAAKTVARTLACAVQFFPMSSQCLRNIFATIYSQLPLRAAARRGRPPPPLQHV